MSLCSGCDRPAVRQVVVCAECRRNFHNSCSLKYIAKSTASKCCIQNFSRSRGRTKSSPDSVHKFDFLRVNMTDHNNCNEREILSKNSDNTASQTHERATVTPPTRTQQSISLTVPPPVPRSLLTTTCFSSLSPIPSNALGSSSTVGVLPFELAAGTVNAQSTANVINSFGSLIDDLKEHISSQFNFLVQRQDLQQQQLESILNSQAATISALEKRVDDLTGINNRLDEHDALLKNISSSVETNEARLKALENDRAASRSLASTPVSVLIDTAELIISGIPADLEITPLETVNKVLISLDLSQLVNDVLSAEAFPRPSA